MPEGSEIPEMIIGETDFKPEEKLTPEPSVQPNPEHTPSTPTRPLWKRVLEGTKNAMVPQPIPVEKMTDQMIASALKHLRIENLRGGENDRINQQITVPDVLSGLNYTPNWEVGKTDWRQKYPDAYGKVREQLDQLTRSGALEPAEGYQNDPDKEIMAWKVKNPEAIIELAKPKTPSQP